VAQLVAHLHGMQGVRGSSPLRSTTVVCRNFPAFSLKLKPVNLTEEPCHTTRFSIRLSEPEWLHPK
jgi:hypothetical protein